MKSVDNVGVTFVNVVLGRGVLNGVVNLQFGVCQFTADDEANKVDPDIVTNCRLRMDMTCAKQLHAQLSELLRAIEESAEKLPGSEPLPAEEQPSGVSDKKAAAKGKTN